MLAGDAADTPTETAPGAAARGRLADSAVWVGTAALLVVCFHGLMRLNRVDSSTMRGDLGEALGRMPVKEATLLMGLVFLAAPAALLLARALHRWAGAPLGRALEALGRRPALVVGGAALVAFVAAAALSWLALGHTRLTDDENVHLFQAWLLEAGGLTATAPPASAWFAQPLVVVLGDQWTGVLPWGHAALLAAGDLVGLPQLWPHLTAPLTVVLTYVLAREVHPDGRDVPVALGAAGLAATSPFLVLTAGTLHDATTSVVLVTLGCFLLARHHRRGGFGWVLLAGLAFGLDLHARPLDAVVLGGLAVVLAAVAGRRAGRSAVRLLVGFAVGLAPAVVLQLLLDARLTGDALVTPYQQAGQGALFGFGEMAFGIERTPSAALGEVLANLVRLLVWVPGTALTGLGLVAAAAGARRARQDWLWLAVPVALLGVDLFYFAQTPVDTGPTWFLAAVPFLAIFLARTTAAVPSALERLRGRALGPDERGRASRGAVLLATTIVATSAITFWPVAARALHGAAASVRDPYRLLAYAGVVKGLVVLSPAPGPGHATEPDLPHPDLTDALLFVHGDREVATDIDELARAFPDRRIFTVRYPGGTSVVAPWQARR